MFDICDDNIYDIGSFLDNTGKNSLLRCNLRLYNIIYPMLDVTENGYECIHRSIINSIDVHHIIKDDNDNEDVFLQHSLSQHNLENVKFFKNRCKKINLSEHLYKILNVVILRYTLDDIFNELHEKTINLKIYYDDVYYRYEYEDLDYFFSSIIDKGNIQFINECLRYHAYRNYLVRDDTLRNLFISTDYIECIIQYQDLIEKFKNDPIAIKLININATVDQFQSIYNSHFSVGAFIEKVDYIRDDIFYYIVGKYPSSFIERYKFTLNQFKFLYNLDREVWGRMMNLNLVFKHSRIDIQFYNYLLYVGYDPRQYPMHIYWIINSGNLELIHQYILLCGNIKLDYKHSIFTYALCNTKCEKIRKILRQYATPQLLLSLNM